jgi:hypothetical protein
MTESFPLLRGEVYRGKEFEKFKELQEFKEGATASRQAPREGAPLSHDYDDTSPIRAIRSAASRSPY